MWGSSTSVHRPARTYTHAHVSSDTQNRHGYAMSTLVHKNFMCDCYCTVAATK